MNLTKREKVLLFILLLTIAFYGYYNYLYLPKYSKYLSIKGELEDRKLLELKLQRSLRDSEDIRTVLNSLKIKVRELDKIIPSKVYQEEVILLLKDIFERNNINFTSISFSMLKNGENLEKNIEPSLDIMIKEYEKLLKGEKTDILKYKTLKEDKEDKENQKKSDEGIDNQGLEYLNVNVNFSSDYSDLKSALLEFERSKRKIVVKNISIANNKEGVIGSMSLQFPYYPVLGEAKKEELDFKGQYGNPQPFMSHFPIEQGENQVQKNKKKNSDDEGEEKVSINSDFYMIIKPISSDMPTVTIGKSPYRYTAIYADNPNFENTKLHLKQENTKLYYRYENSLYSYPDDNSFEEFTIDGEKIVLKIYSQPRLNYKDNSGVILNIVNDTDIGLDVYIYDDDRDNPRIKINPENGNINILKISS